jgi:hypothetical protein
MHILSIIKIIWIFQRARAVAAWFTSIEPSGETITKSADACSDATTGYKMFAPASQKNKNKLFSFHIFHKSSG